MELNSNKKAELPASRFADIQRASETRSAEIRETVDRVQTTSSEQRERTEEISKRSDSIDLSDAARELIKENDTAREERIEELRKAVGDGTLFNRDRLEKAAERLLSHS